jgi:hypothetical protein
VVKPWKWKDFFLQTTKVHASNRIYILYVCAHNCHVKLTKTQAYILFTKDRANIHAAAIKHVDHITAIIMQISRKWTSCPYKLDATQANTCQAANFQQNITDVVIITSTKLPTVISDRRE